MSFVIYNVNTTMIYRAPRTRKEYYATEAAAKAARTRMRSISRTWTPADVKTFAIADAKFFHDHIEKQETKRNLLSGKEFTQPVNTPRCCDPSSELYWSM